MGKKSIKKNYLMNVSYQILSLLTPLITTPYVSRVLGADGIGVYSYTDSVTTYFVLFATMGITTFGQREISYLQDNREKRSHLFWETKVLEIITALITLVCFLLFAIRQDNFVIYLLYSFNIISVLFDVTWFYQGMEEFGIIVFRNIIFKILNIIFIFGFVRKQSDLLIYVVGITGFALISNISLWFGLFKFIDKPDPKNIKPFRNLKVVISLFIPTIAIQIYTVLDKTMIGAITKSSFENGYYEQAIKISKMVLLLVTSLGTVMIPRIGYYFVQKDTKMVKSLMYRGYRFVWFLGIPLCLGLIGISNNFVPWFFGNGFGKVIPLLSVLSFLVPAIGINNVTGMQYLIPTGRQKIFTETVIVGAVCNFILNAILIPIYQSVGASIASVVAECVIAVLQLIIVRKEINPIEVLKSGAHYFVSGLVMLVVLILESYFLTPTIVHTFLMVVSGGLIYVILLVICHDDFFLSNTKIIISKIKR